MPAHNVTLWMVAGTRHGHCTEYNEKTKNNVEDEKDNTLSMDIGFVLCYGDCTYHPVCRISEWQVEDVGVNRQSVETHVDLRRQQVDGDTYIDEA